jgi:threonine dehydratase
VLIQEKPRRSLPTADDVEAASTRIADEVITTPLHLSDRLSTATGAQVYLKREDLQSVRSYKIRGAFNFLLQLSEAERKRGVVCASAGNHAQGLARACAALGVSGTIFVPKTTPRQKIERIRHFGGRRVEVVIEGSTYDDASDLLAGILAYTSVHMPGTTVVGVEPAGAASMMAAMAAGRPVTLSNIDSFADGAAVRRAGDITYEMLSQHDLPLFTVPEGRAATEMLDLYQVEGIIAEPAGALASAAVGPTGSDAPVTLAPGSTAVCLVSGGNNDISRYPEVLERSLVHEGIKHYFIVDFPQEPGALRRFLNDVLGPDDDIAMFEYVKRSDRETGPAFVGITLGRPSDLGGLLERMDESPLQIERVSQDSPLFRMFV